MGVLRKTISFTALFTFDIFTKYRIPHNDFHDPFNDILLTRRCRDVEIYLTTDQRWTTAQR